MCPADEFSHSFIVSTLCWLSSHFQSRMRFSSLWDNFMRCVLHLCFSWKVSAQFGSQIHLQARGVVLHHLFTPFTVLSAAAASLKSCFVQTCVNAGVIDELPSAKLSCCHHTHHDTPLDRSGISCLQDEIKSQAKMWKGVRGVYLLTSLIWAFGLQEFL